MKINRIELNNYAQHQSVDVVIDSNFTGIVGENGSGKSNFIAPICDAITGDFQKKKEKLITHGKKDGSIQISGDFDGQAFSVFRSLKGSGAWLELEGEETIHGSEDVTFKILEKLDCDKVFLENMVFVKQEDLLGVLFGRPAARNKLLQRFFGLERAQKIDATLSSWLSNVPVILVNDKKEVEKMIQTEQANLEDVVVEIESLRKSIENLEPTKEELESIEKVKKKRDEVAEYESNTEKLKTLSSKIVELQKELLLIAPPSTTQEEIDQSTAWLQTMGSTIESKQGLVNFLMRSLHINHSSVCVVCNSEMTEGAQQQLKERIEEMKSEIKGLTSKRDKVLRATTEASQELQEYNKKVKRVTKDIETNQAIKQGIEDSLSGSPPKHKLSDYDSFLEGCAAEKMELIRLKAGVKPLEDKKLSIEASIKNYRNILADIESKIAEKISTENHKQRITRLQGLFKHNGSATEAYVHRKMQLMSTCINTYLSWFNASFRVRVGKDNDFLCTFGGKMVSSMDLSGGEKVVLSLAFKFASCELFTSKASLIVLDEPTTWLDQKRIGSFGEVFQNLKAICGRKNFQVFVVTHERSLMPFFDQVIEF